MKNEPVANKGDIVDFYNNDESGVVLGAIWDNVSYMYSYYVRFGNGVVKTVSEENIIVTERSNHAET